MRAANWRPTPSGLAHTLRRARIKRVGDMDDAALVAALIRENQALVSSTVAGMRWNFIARPKRPDWTA